MIGLSIVNTEEKSGRVEKLDFGPQNDKSSIPAEHVNVNETPALPLKHHKNRIGNEHTAPSHVHSVINFVAGLKVFILIIDLHR